MTWPSRPCQRIFLPIAIARFVGDPFGGWIYQTAKALGRPEIIWLSLIAIGVLAAVLMFLYNWLLVPKEEDSNTRKLSKD